MVSEEEMATAKEMAVRALVLDRIPRLSIEDGTMMLTVAQADWRRLFRIARYLAVDGMAVSGLGTFTLPEVKGGE